MKEIDVKALLRVPRQRSTKANHVALSEDLIQRHIRQAKAVGRSIFHLWLLHNVIHQDFAAVS